MEDIVISLKNVTKKYKLYKNSKLKLKHVLIGKKTYSEKIALNNVSFDVYKGESVAILGRNGAGKSTIIKLVSEIAYPTEGSILVKGKKTSLLGTEIGLEPELTGRENILLKCSLLGIEEKEIQKIEKSIIEFSEIEEYIDQPLKLYSSGMRARLGFAISVQTEPDILIIDETLSVGDEQFKKKCINKISQIIKTNNTTLLLVTHSKETAVEFCKRGIVIEKGEKIFDGEIEMAIENYEKILK